MKNLSSIKAVKLMLLVAMSWTGIAVAQQERIDLTGAMVYSVQAFLNGLSAAQRQQATYTFADEERLNWHFIPRPRNGLSFNEMNDEQQQLAAQVMTTFLSARGFEKVLQIRELETVLDRIEVNGRFVRDPNAYFLTVFGEPSLNGTWAFRFEGHHIALNWTFIEGQGIASSPQFFGSNPAEVPSGPTTGLRVLAAEEDLARQLVLSMDGAQRATAVLTMDVPGDIFTGAEDEITPMANSGITFGGLTSGQQHRLLSLIAEIANAQPDVIAAERMAAIQAGSANIRFTWIGGMGRTDGHYWRIQGSDFLIEYDKTQNEANHIHLVWRDFDGDFGRDLIRLHYDAVAATYGPGHHH
jgi:hypothetical protein